MENFFDHRKDFNYTNEYDAISHDKGKKKELDAAPQKTDEQYKAAYQEYLKGNTPYRTHNWARGNSAIAIGSRSIAYGDGATALGTLAIAQGNLSTALGTGTLSLGQSSIAIGNEAYVYANNSVGVGNHVQAISNGSMVYGYNSYVAGEGGLAFGQYALANVKADAQFATLQSIYRGTSTVEGEKGLGGIDKEKSKFQPQKSKQQGSGEDKVEGIKVTVDGNQYKTGGIAIGYYVNAEGENAIAFGKHAYAEGDRSMALGPYAYSQKEHALALGYGAKALASNSFAIGVLSRAENKNAIAFGNNATVKLDNSLSLGFESKTDYTEDELKQKPYAPKTAILMPTSAQKGVISVGSKNSERRIVNVAPGARDTDAANVAQLKSLEERIDLALGSQGGATTPYFAVDQNATDSEAKHITDGQNAIKNYERYLNLASKYAHILNRKIHNGEQFNDEILKTIQKEIDELGKNNKIAETAADLTKVLEELQKQAQSSALRKDEQKFAENTKN